MEISYFKLKEFMAIFDSTTLTAEQQTVKRMDITLKRAATDLKRAYDALRRDIYNNPDFTPEEIYAAFATSTETGLNPDQLGRFARAVKTLINQAQAGTIVDDVAEATITY